MDNSFYTLQGNNLILRIYVQPNASRDEIVGIFDNYLKIRIKSPPIEGKVNKHLSYFLAEQFGVPKSNVTLTKGAQSRRKEYRIRFPKRVPNDIMQLCDMQIP